MKSKVLESGAKRKLKSYIPFGVQKLLYTIIKKARLLSNAAQAKYTKEDLKKFLVQAGLRKGDVVMLHSSLGRIGYVENGADAVIDAFLETIGNNGLLVMPTFSTPEFDGQKKAYIFDVKKTKSYTGAIPETFRLRKGVRRSMSPMHSVAACGKKAGWLVEGHEKCDNPYSIKGPFGRLYGLNAKIFQIGVDQLANSCIHIVEDKIKFPVKVFTEKMKAIVTDEKGRKKTIYFRRHLPDLYRIRDNNMLEPHLLRRGLISMHKFGNTELRVHRVRDLVHMMEELASQGITIYSPSLVNNPKFGK